MGLVWLKITKNTIYIIRNYGWQNLHAKTWPLWETGSHSKTKDFTFAVILAGDKIYNMCIQYYNEMV